MKDFKSHFRFDKQERNGIFFLVLLIVLLQSTLFFIRTHNGDEDEVMVLDSALQGQIDSLKQAALKDSKPRIYPFNPNFITDYKGYTLGMSPQEIGRLLKFRESGKYVDSASEFQKVTQVSDSLLHAMAPYFKFPQWTQKKDADKTLNHVDVRFPKKNTKRNQIIDLNKATAEELRRISGIGEKLSARIIKFRDRLGGFLVNEQLYDVYGLDIQVADRAMEQFQVLDPPTVKKIEINSASADELSSLIYISKRLAYQIIAYRNQNGPFKSIGELGAVPDFPKEKIDRIGLYLWVSKD